MDFHLGITLSFSIRAHLLSRADYKRSYQLAIAFALC